MAGTTPSAAYRGRDHCVARDGRLVFPRQTKNTILAVVVACNIRVTEESQGSKTDGVETVAKGCRVRTSEASRLFRHREVVSGPGEFGARCVVVMADVDSLLSELDGLLKDSPPGQRPPQRPSAAAAAPRLAPGRPEVEDDIESLLSSLGGAEAFSSSAASRATCAPRATCPPALAPSSSSAPPDGASCETTCVPRYAVPVHPRAPAPQPPCLLRGSLRCSKCDFKVVRFDDQRWSDSVDYMFFRNFMGHLAELQTLTLT